MSGRQASTWGRAQRQRLNKQGSAEKNGALEDEGLSDRGHRLTDRPRQRTMGQHAHPQQSAADTVDVGLAGDLKGDEAADHADASGEEHRADSRLGVPADDHDGTHGGQQCDARPDNACSQVQSGLSTGRAQNCQEGVNAHEWDSLLLTRER